MLLVALLLLAAAGLLVTSFLTGDTAWAWASIAVSGLAAGALVVRWWRLRKLRAARAGRHRSPEVVVVGEPAAGADGSDAGADDGSDDAAPTPQEGDEAAEREGAVPAPAAPATPAAVIPDPDEEDTDAADLLVVCELEDAVVVVDEYPRYHLARCDWLASRPMEPLSVREARELGFTPCARCGPDAVIAERYRAARSG